MLKNIFIVLKNKLFSTNNLNNKAYTGEIVNKYFTRLKYSNSENIKGFFDEYFSFYKDYRNFIENKMKYKKISKEDKNFYYRQLLKIDYIYNEVYNYHYFMSQNKIFDSYKKQKEFVESKPLEFIIKQAVNNKHKYHYYFIFYMRVSFSILCFKYNQNIEKQNMSFDLKKYFDYMEKYHKATNNTNFNYYLLLKSFNEFIVARESLIDLNEENKNILNDDDELYKNYDNQIFNQSYYFLEKIYENCSSSEEFKNHKYKIASQFTGLGKYYYLTNPLPNSFKNYVQKVFSDLIDIDNKKAT